MRVRGLSRGLLARWLEGFSLDDPRLTTALTHYAAFAASLVILVVQHNPLLARQVPGWLVIFLGVSGLRIMTAGHRLVRSTAVFDALAMVVFLSGTGAPSSPFYLLALAGAWWAGRLRQPRSGLLYGLVFATGYLVLTLPIAIRELSLASLVEQVTALVAIALLSDWFHALDNNAVALSDALRSAPAGIEQLAVREHLQRALRHSDVPVDVVLTAGQVGLTAAQTELLSYLVLGLSNLEIADAAAVSEATTRYRLTRLYRTLGVRGRRAAVARAHELGLVGWIEGGGRTSARLLISRSRGTDASARR
jgi:DNA-binding CsgD family transcriptional regulator